MIFKRIYKILLGVVLRAMMIISLPMLLFVFIPKDETDHIYIHTSADEIFYFKGHIEQTFPKPYGYKYALYEVKKNKNVLIQSRENSRYPEFYFNEENFDEKKDVISIKYPYKNQVYQVHKIKNEILYKTSDEKNYNILDEHKVVSQPQKYMFLLPMMKESIKKNTIGQIEKMKSLLYIDKNHLKEKKWFDYKEITRLIEHNQDSESSKIYEYDYDSNHYKVHSIWNGFIYLKNNEEYDVLDEKEVLQSPKYYSFLAPIYLERLQKIKRVRKIKSIAIF